MMVHAHGAELIDDNGGVGIGRVLHQPVQQRGLAAAQEAGQHDHADAPVGAAVLDGSILHTRSRWRTRRSGVLLAAAGGEAAAAILTKETSWRCIMPVRASSSTSGPWGRP